MNARIVFGAIALVATTSPAFAADAGWRITFYEDAFLGETLPEARARQISDSVMATAYFGLACRDGELVVTAFPDTLITMSKTIEVAARGPNGIHRATFVAVKLPIVGERFVVRGSEADAFIDVFSNSSGPVPVEIDGTSMNFTSIGFSETFEIMQEACSVAE